MSHSKRRRNLPDIFLQIRKGRFYDGSERDPHEKAQIRRPPGRPTAYGRDMVGTAKDPTEDLDEDDPDTPAGSVATSAKFVYGSDGDRDNDAHVWKPTGRAFKHANKAIKATKGKPTSRRKTSNIRREIDQKCGTATAAQRTARKGPRIRPRAKYDSVAIATDETIKISDDAEDSDADNDDEGVSITYDAQEKRTDTVKMRSINGAAEHSELGAEWAESPELAKAQPRRDIRSIARQWFRRFQSELLHKSGETSVLCDKYRNFCVRRNHRICYRSFILWIHGRTRRRLAKNSEAEADKRRRSQMTAKGPAQVVFDAKAKTKKARAGRKDNDGFKPNSDGRIERIKEREEKWKQPKIVKQQRHNSVDTAGAAHSVNAFRLPF